MIKEISYEQYAAFVAERQLDFYTQHPEVKMIANLPIHFLGYFQDNQLMTVSNYYTLKYKKIFKVAYFVQSEVFDSHSSHQLIEQYYQALKRYFKNKGYAYINIYPTLRCGKYHINGDASHCHIDQQQLLKNINVIYPKRQHFVIPNIMCIKSVLELTEDTLTQGMSTNVKRLLKTANKEGLQIKRISVDELPAIYSVFEASADRKNFDIFSLEKMTKILSAMPNHMYIDVVYVHRQNKLVQLKQQLAQAQDDKKYQLLQQQIEFLEQDTSEHAILGAGLFYHNQEQIFYQMGGSYQLFNRWGTMIQLMYHQIEQAHHHGLAYYNFGGIFCYEVDKAALEQDSLYHFKRKFNSELVGYGKEFIIPIKSWMTKFIHLT